MAINLAVAGCADILRNALRLVYGEAGDSRGALGGDLKESGA